MIEYPKIEYYTKGRFGEPVIAFDKYDGSNIRVEWSRKRFKKCVTGDAYYKFGSRTQLICDKTPILGKAVDIFFEKYADGIEKVFVDNREYKNVDSFVAFLEYFGPNSFAGWHDMGDEMDLMLFDIFQKKKGFVKPESFINDFGHLGTPKVIYKGELTMDFINDVKSNVYDLKEGIVGKGVISGKKGVDIWMIKAKTIDWLTKVKAQYGAKALLTEVNNDSELLV